MSSAHGRSRDQVFEGMNELIDAGRICMPKEGETYCLPATFEALKKREMGGKKMKRSDFDRLSYAERNEHINNGGTVIAG